MDPRTLERKKQRKKGKDAKKKEKEKETEKQRKRKTILVIGITQVKHLGFIVYVQILILYYSPLHVWCTTALRLHKHHHTL